MPGGDRCFHVFPLEQPGVGLEWRPRPFPARGGSLLEDVDVSLLLEPPRQDGICCLTLDVSPMVVLVAAGDPLAHHIEPEVAGILDRPFPGSPNLNPEWRSFWT